MISNIRYAIFVSLSIIGVSNAETYPIGNLNVHAQQPKFESCRKAEAFKRIYGELNVQLPVAEFSCDNEFDRVVDSSRSYKFKNYEEALAQYAKDIMSIKSTVDWSEYTYPNYELTNQDLTSILSKAIDIKFPKIFENLGANDSGVVFFYKNSTRWVSKDVVSFWYLQSFFKGQRIGSTTAYSYKAQVAINCRNESLTTLQSLYFITRDDSGPNWASESIEISKAKFVGIPPNTLWVNFHQKLCAKQKTRQS